MQSFEYEALRRFEHTWDPKNIIFRGHFSNKLALRLSYVHYCVRFLKTLLVILKHFSDFSFFFAIFLQVLDWSLVDKGGVNVCNLT